MTFSISFDVLYATKILQLFLSEKRLTGAFEGKFEGPVNLSSFGSLSYPGVLLNNYNFRSINILPLNQWTAFNENWHAASGPKVVQ